MIELPSSAQKVWNKLVFAAASAALGHLAHAAPVLITYDATLTTNPPAITQLIGANQPKVAQPIGMTYFHRGAFLDGTERMPWSIGAEIAANSADPAALGDRSVEDVRLISGQYEPTEIDLHLPCIGPDWVVGRTRVATPQSGGTIHGSQWFQISQSRIWFKDVAGDADDVVFLFYGGDRYLEFRRVMNENVATTTFRGVNGVAGAITYQAAGVGGGGGEGARSGGQSFGEQDPPPEMWTYHDPRGVTVEYFGWTLASLSGVYDGRGQIWRITDASGYSSYVGHATNPNTALTDGYDAEGRIKVAVDSAGRSYAYTYGTIGSGGSAPKRLMSVVATKASTEIARVEYQYYTSANAEGASAVGDLKCAEVRTPSSAGTSAADLVETTRYRYWKSNSQDIDGFSHGAAGSVRLVLGPEGSRLAAATADTATDLTLAGFGALRLGYAASKVSKIQSDGLLTRFVMLAYASSTAPFPLAGYDDLWAKRTNVEVRKGSTYVTATDYFFDEVAQSLWSVRLAADAGGTSAASILASNVDRDAMGCVVAIGSPESVNITVGTYNPADSLPLASAGLVVKFERIPAAGSPADLVGFAMSVGRAVGWVNGASVQTSLLYLNPTGINTPQKVLNGYTILRPLLASTTRLPGGGSDPETTLYHYTLNTGAAPGSSLALAIDWLKVEHPKVTVAEHGSNEETESAIAFLPNGLPTYVRGMGDANGTRSAFVYSMSGAGVADATGAVIEVHQDTASGFTPGGMPAAPSLFLGGAINPKAVSTKYEYDAQGRVKAVIDADGNRHESAYGATSDGHLMWVEATRMGATGSYASPASWGIVNQAGITEYSGTLASDTNAGYAQVATLPSGPVNLVNWTGWNSTAPFALASGSGFSVRTPRSLTLSNDGLRVKTSRAYHTVVTGGGSGAISTNYDETVIGYDDIGRPMWVVSPAGAAYWKSMDGFGRTDELLRGIAATPSQTPPFTNSGRIAAYDYTAASGRLSMMTLYPFGPHTVSGEERYTNYVYDPYGDLKAIAGPIAPHRLFDRDNLGRVVASASYFDSTNPTFNRDNFIVAAPSMNTSSATNRYRLHTRDFDGLGRVWWESDTRLFGPTFASMVDKSVVTERWFDPQGRLALSHGASTHKYMYADRMTAAQDVASISFTIAMAAMPANYEAAMAIGSNDYVLHERHVLSDPTRRFTDLVVDVSRYPRGATTASDNSSMLMGGFIQGGVPVSLSGAANGRVQVKGYKRDALQRQVGAIDFGNGWVDTNSTNKYTSIVRSNVNDFTDQGYVGTNATVHANIRKLDSLGRTVHSMDERGAQKLLGYDELSRVVFTQETHGAGFGGTFFEGGNPCAPNTGMPPHEIKYKDGNVEQICMGSIEACDVEIEEVKQPPRDNPLELCAQIYSQCDPRKFHDPDLGGMYGVPTSGFTGSGSTLNPPLRDETYVFRNWIGEVTNSVDPARVQRTVLRDKLGRPTHELFDYTLASTANSALDTSVVSTEYGWTTCSQCKYANTTLKYGSSQVVQTSAATFDAWQLEKTLIQLPKVLQDSQWTDVLPSGTGTDGMQLNWDFIEGQNNTQWRGPRMESVFLHGSARSTSDFPDEEFGYGDALGTFGQGPIDIDATIGRLSRTTNQKLPDCVGSGDCFKQIIEKHGYYGIWPMPGSGESLGQMPSGGLEDWGHYPSGIVPLEPNTSGLDPWGNPIIDLTQPMCVSATPNCCNTCPTEQDTRHEDNRPDPNICACIYKYDHQEPENDKTKEIQCSGIASTETGMDTGSSLAPPPVVKETWAYDSTKRNWASHSYNKFDGTTGAPMWDQRGYYERTMTFNQADQPTQEVIKRSEFVNNAWVESSTVETNEIRFDKRGNLWADGKRVFNYDAYNRLTGVWHRSTAPNAHIEDKGNPIAAFTYDGYGHRLTARYNSTKPETNQATLNDDPVDIYSYDHLWRVRTVTQATYHSSTSSWSSFVREQWFYRNSEDPTQYKIGSDAPVMRRIDVNGDGTFEETQNFVTDRQGSVVAVLGDAVPVDVNNESLGMKPGEVIARVRYDTYGVPTICDPADIDRDGVVDLVDVALYCTYWNAWHANSPTSTRYKEILDYNRDGVVDANDPCTSSNADYLAFTTRAGLVMTEVVPDVKDVVGNLPLYAGYWWDAQLGMYHVRHRVYRPEWGKWIQRDPLGYAAGWNLYEYVGGEPWRTFDPYGLDSYVPGFMRGTAVGDAIDDSIDGAIEAVEVTSDALFDTDLTGDKGHNNMLDEQAQSLGEKVGRLVIAGGQHGDKIARDFMYFLSQQRSDMDGVGDIRSYERQRIGETAIDIAITLASGPIGKGLGLAGKAILSRVIGRKTATAAAVVITYLTTTFRTPISTGFGRLANSSVAKIVGREVGIGAAEAAAAKSAGLCGSSPKVPYNRKLMYPNTPTAADRASGRTDHVPSLVRRYYDGDPAIGEAPGHLLTPAERAASAADKSRLFPPIEDYHSQGARERAYSLIMRKRYFGY